MKTGRLVTSTLTLGMIVSACCALQAADTPPPGRRAQHADQNNDGKVTPREWHKEKKWEHQQKASVDKPWEEKADKNNDGIVQPVEARKAASDTYLEKRSTANRDWEKKADTDNDGKVSAGELRAFHILTMDKNNDGKVDPIERKAFWVHRKSKVNTEAEKKYDADGNGWLTGDEARQYLRDRLLVVNTQGKAIVNSDLERAYDANRDGIIDAEEAKVMKEALEDN